MTTITVQIGNSDDKLTQEEWSGYVWEVAIACEAFAEQVHFHGFSPAGEPWQNAAWVLSVSETFVLELQERLAAIRAKYRQESIAWTEGATAFI